MSNFKTLTIIVAAAALAAPTFAQEAEPDASIDPSSDPVVVDFVSADLNQNGSLNAEEFVTFAVMRAQGGEEAFKDIVMGGEYSPAFALYDTDASGTLEAAELSVHNDITPELGASEQEKDGAIPPEN